MSKSNYHYDDLLDALFFASYKPLHIDQIKRILGVSDRKTAREIVSQYISKFNRFHKGIEIIRRKDYYYLSIKREYVDKVKRFFMQPPITERQKEVLALIYDRKRISASELRDYFGPRVYSDLKRLSRLGLIKRERIGNKIFVSLKEGADLLIFKGSRK